MGARYSQHGLTGVIFTPHRTLLLVADPVNDFLSEDEAGCEHVDKLYGSLSPSELEDSRERGA